MEKKFNPTTKDFLEKNKNMTLLGLAWSLWWRIYVVAFAVGFFVALILEL